ncbi:MAG: phosphomannomutase/phosphoglucomutase [Desulfovibrionaceae bacterium]
MTAFAGDVFRAYDIRGVVGKDFDESWVERLGLAVGAHFRKHGLGRAVVGRDVRPSSESFESALAKGLLSAGVDVILLGEVPTPVFYFAALQLNTRAGVVVTASHNPPQYNGFKIWRGPTTIHGEEIQQIRRIFETEPTPAGAPGLLSRHDILPAYYDDALSEIRLRNPVKVVLDGGNGVAGPVCLELLRRAGADVVPLYCDLDGRFPNHHPDPMVEANLAALKDKVLAEGAHLGVALDGDGDRLGAVDETGAFMAADRLLALFARDVLEERPGAQIIGDVKCTQLLFDDIEAHGGKAIMAATGHSLMKAKILETGAPLAGELSGHLFFNDRHHGYDDAAYAALRLVEILAKDPARPLSGRLADWPATAATPEQRIHCPDAIKFKVVQIVRDRLAEDRPVVDIDGVRAVFPDGWGLLRASNTEPDLVLRFEASSKEGACAIKKTVMEALNEALRKIGG